MAIALVGTAGAFTSVSVSPVSGAWGTSQNRTAGNLLTAAICCKGSSTVAPSAAFAAQWVQVGSTIVAGTACTVAMFYAIATGADTLPTFDMTGIATPAFVQMNEWSGNNSSVGSVLDTFGTNTNTAGALGLTVVTTGTVTNAGGLGLGVFYQAKSGGGTATTWTPGSGWTTIGSSTVSATGHGLTTNQLAPTSGSTLTEAMTQTATTIGLAGIVAVFNPSGGAAAQIWQPPRRNVNQAVQRASVY